MFSYQLKHLILALSFVVGLSNFGHSDELQEFVAVLEAQKPQIDRIYQSCQVRVTSTISSTEDQKGWEYSHSRFKTKERLDEIFSNQKFDITKITCVNPDEVCFRANREADGPFSISKLDKDTHTQWQRDIVDKEPCLNAPYGFSSVDLIELFKRDGVKLISSDGDDKEKTFVIQGDEDRTLQVSFAKRGDVWVMIRAECPGEYVYTNTYAGEKHGVPLISKIVRSYLNATDPARNYSVTFEVTKFTPTPPDAIHFTTASLGLAIRTPTVWPKVALIVLLTSGSLGIIVVAKKYRSNE